jgi:hypothetical protein
MHRDYHLVIVARTVEFGVGPGGVYGGPHRDHRRDHGWRHAYDDDRGCRRAASLEPLG